MDSCRATIRDAFHAADQFVDQPIVLRDEGNLHHDRDHEGEEEGVLALCEQLVFGISRVAPEQSRAFAPDGPDVVVIGELISE